MTGKRFGCSRETTFHQRHFPLFLQILMFEQVLFLLSTFKLKSSFSKDRGYVTVEKRLNVVVI